MAEPGGLCETDKTLEMVVGGQNERNMFPVTENSLESYVNEISTKSRAIYWIIIISVSISLILLPFIYVDVTIKVRGVFQSPLERQTILSTAQGKVLYSGIREGAKVRNGDTLLVIATETTKAQLWSVTRQIRETALSIKDLEILTSAKIAELPRYRNKILTSRYRAELLSFEKQITIQAYKTSKSKSDFDRIQILFNQQAVSNVEFENSLYAYNVEKEALEQLQLDQLSRWQTDLAKRREELIILESENKRYEEEIRNRIIVAPLSGEIIESADLQIGSSVFANQRVATISPDGELVAMCFVSPRDIGMVYKEQEVVFQVDAFNHNEWGTLKGYIKNIPDDVITEDGTTAWFVTECALRGSYLELKNGYRGYIRKGMTFNALIILSKRSLFNLLFDKADKWINPNSKTWPQ